MSLHRAPQRSMAQIADEAARQIVAGWTAHPCRRWISRLLRIGM